MSLIELDSLLRTFNVPEMRRTLTQENLRWLIRNLSIQNKEHPNLNEALKEIANKLKGK